MNRGLKKALMAFCSMTLALSASMLVGCSSLAEFFKDTIPSSWVEFLNEKFPWLAPADSEQTSESASESEQTSESANDGTSEENTACHQYGEAVLVKPTCTTKGSSTVTCTICGESVTTVLDATGHTYTLTKEVAACCDAEGYNEYTCGACDDSYTEITADKLGHDTLNAVWTIVGEEQVDGCEWLQYEKATCATCSQPVTHVEQINKHNYEVSITDATCSKDGVKTYECKCGDSYTEDFKNENGHEWMVDTVDTSTGITSWVCKHNDAHTKTSFSAKDLVVATIPATAIQEAKEIELQNATLELPQEVKEQLAGGVELSVDTLDETAKDKATSNLSEDEKEKLANTPIFEFSMMQGENAVTKFEKEITVTVPYTLEQGADPADIAVWYIDDEGKLTSIKATYSVVGDEGFATFTTDHFSYYTVVRLSAKERCALYGCEERVTVVAPTCEVDGYTLTKCIRCNKTTRSAFVKALGHTYTTNTVAPTCTTKGYTMYSCTRTGCKHSYQANWKDMLAHNYEKTVVEPTCTAKGYTVTACTGCGDSYVDNYVDAKGHNYQDGECSVCGKKDPSSVSGDSFNFYFNAIESLLNANSYYLEVNDWSVDYIDIQYSVRNGKEVKFETSSMVTRIDDMKVELSLDEAGNIVGKGVATMTQTQDYNGDIDEIVATAQMAIRNGQIYMLATGMYNGEEMDSKMTMSLDALLMHTDLSMEMLQSMLEGAGEVEDLVAILEGIKDTPDSPLNRLISDVLEYVYTKTETENGYHFELNFDRAEEVYSVLTEKTVEETIDLVLGEGAYAQVCNYLKASIDKEVGVVVEDLTTALALCGVDMENVYNLIDLMSGDEEFNVREMVKQFSTMKVSEFLDTIMNVEAGSIDYKAMIDQYANGLKETSAMELIVMLISSTGGNQGTVTPDSNYPVDKPNEVPDSTYPTEKPEEYSETDVSGKPVAKRASIVNDNTMYSTLMKIVETLKLSSFSFDTDKTGEVLYYTMDVVGLGDMGTLQEKLDQLEEEAFDHYQEVGNFVAYTSFMKINGKIVFKPNGSYVGSYDQLVQMGEEMQDVAAQYFQEVIAGTISNVSLNVDILDGEMFTYFYDWGMEEGDKWEDEENPDKETGKTEEESWTETTYAGQKAWMKLYYGSISMATNPATMITTEADCLDWEHYSVSGIQYNGVYYTIWKNANGEYIGVELSEGATPYDTTSVASFYYNTTTGKFAVLDKYSDSMHNYELVEHKEAEGCEGKGYNKYVCTNCNNVDMQYYTNGHDMERLFELSEGSKTCDDGVDLVYYCKKCETEIGREENWTYGHEMMYKKQVIATTKCGDLLMETHYCACGMYQKEANVSGGCEFDYVETWDSETGEGEAVYRCAVTACAYTYTVKYVDEAQVGCQVYRKIIYRFGVTEAGGDADFEHTAFFYVDTRHMGYHNEVTQDATGLYTVHEYCTACDSEFQYHQARYDKYGHRTYFKQLLKNRAPEEWEAGYENCERELKNYYRDLLYGDGWRREYTGCYYVEYSLDGDERGCGDVHDWCWVERYPYESSCTQYQYGGTQYVYCFYCGELEKEGEAYWAPNDHNYHFEDSLGLYVCDRCDMKNETGADAKFIIEDLTGVVSDAYAVGYYNRNWLEYSVYVVANYGEGGEERYLDGVTCTDRVTHMNSGIITLNMTELRLELNSLGLEDATISVVMQYYDRESGEYDPATDTWEGSWIDCVVTFE